MNEWPGVNHVGKNPYKSVKPASSVFSELLRIRLLVPRRPRMTLIRPIGTDMPVSDH